MSPLINSSTNVGRNFICVHFVIYILICQKKHRSEAYITHTVRFTEHLTKLANGSDTISLNHKDC